MIAWSWACHTTNIRRKRSITFWGLIDYDLQKVAGMVYGLPCFTVSLLRSFTIKNAWFDWWNPWIAHLWVHQNQSPFTPPTDKIGHVYHRLESTFIKTKHNESETNGTKYSTVWHFDGILMFFLMFMAGEPPRIPVATHTLVQRPRPRSPTWASRPAQHQVREPWAISIHRYWRNRHPLWLWLT